MLQGKGAFGKRTLAFKNYLNNLDYHSELKRQHVLNPKHGDFDTLNKYLDYDYVAKESFTNEAAARADWSKLRNLRTPKQFFQAWKVNPDNIFFKGLNKLSGKGGRIGLGATGLLAMTAALQAATPKDKGLTTEEVKERGGPGFVDRVSETIVEGGGGGGGGGETLVQ